MFGDRWEEFREFNSRLFFRFGKHGVWSAGLHFAEFHLLRRCSGCFSVMSGGRFFSAVRPFERGLSEVESLRLQVKQLEQENGILRMGRGVRNEVAPAEETHMRAIFTRYDLDGDGSIDVKELGALFSDLGEKMTPAEVSEVMTAFVSRGFDFSFANVFLASVPNWPPVIPRVHQLLEERNHVAR